MLKILIAFVFMMLVAGCGEKKPGIPPPNSVWPYELYQKFNLRTIVSSYSGYLNYYCASYPQDFYRPDQVVMPSTDKVVIENEGWYLSFDLVSKNQVIVRDEIKGASYKAEHLYTFYYNEEHDDYRADTFYIEIPKNCKKLVLKEDENVSQ